MSALFKKSMRNKTQMASTRLGVGRYSPILTSDVLTVIFMVAPSAGTGTLGTNDSSNPTSTSTALFEAFPVFVAPKSSGAGAGLQLAEQCDVQAVGGGTDPAVDAGLMRVMECDFASVELHAGSFVRPQRAWVVAVLGAHRHRRPVSQYMS